MKEIHIGMSSICEKSPPLIVAEMSGNHNQSLDRALEIVDSITEEKISPNTSFCCIPDGTRLHPSSLVKPGNCVRVGVN